MAVTQDLARRYNEASGSLRRQLPASPGLLAVLGAFAVLVVCTLYPDYATNQRLQAASVLLGLAVVIAAARTLREALWGAGALVVAWIVVQVLLLFARDVDMPPSVDEAVGYAATNGGSYLPAQAATMLALALAFAAGLVVLWRRGAVAEIPTAIPKPLRADRRMLAVGVVLWLTLAPSLATTLVGDPPAPVGYDWDIANRTVWWYLMEDGLQPIRDFFWPYGESWIFEMQPWGPIWMWLAEGLMLSLAGFSLWRLSGARPWRTAAGLLVLTILLAWSPFVERYVPPLLLAATYAAAGPLAHRRPVRAHIAVALAALYAMFVEADLLLMGIAGILCILAGELVAGRMRGSLTDLVRRLLVDALPFTAALLVPLFWLATGSLDENLRFWTGLTDASAASAFTGQGGLSGLVLQASLKPMYFALALGQPMLLFTAGLVLARRDDANARSAAMLFLAGAGVSQLLLMKIIVRPAFALMYLVVWVVVLWGAFLLWNRRSTVLVLTVGVFLGAAFLTHQQGRIVSLWLDNAVAAPEHVARDVQLLAGSELDRNERERFDPERFQAWPETAVAARLRAAMASSPDKSFAVLGDLQLLYVLFDREPPYHVQNYDAARLEEQEAVIADLERDKPHFLVWRRSPTVDGLPQELRNPLLIRYAIEHYAPVSRGQETDILVRTSTPDRKYWAERLPSTVSLGYIPSLSHADDAETCSGGPGCVRYAMLEGTGKRGQVANLRIIGSAGTFIVEVNARPGVTTYPVRLDRMWFAPWLGPDPKVESMTDGWQAQLESRRTGDELY